LDVPPLHIVKCALEFVWSPHREALQLQFERLGDVLHRVPVGGYRIVRVHEGSHARQLRHGLFEQFDPFPADFRVKKLDPVMLPPGRAKLATMPPAIGSPMIAITMGMVVVARLAAAVAGVPCVTITSTLRRTNSSASARRRACACSAQRYSLIRFVPST